MLRRAALIVPVVVIGLTGVALAFDPFSSPAGALAQQAPPPGLQPAVQSWMKGRERMQIELNDALVPIVQQKIGATPAGQAPCRRLLVATRVLTGRAAAPHARVNELARAGLAKFEQGAAACLAGDPATAARLVTEGLAERTAAQEPLDELLEGE